MEGKQCDRGKERETDLIRADNLRESNSQARMATLLEANQRLAQVGLSVATGGSPNDLMVTFLIL